MENNLGRERECLPPEKRALACFPPLKKKKKKKKKPLWDKMWADLLEASSERLTLSTFEIPLLQPILCTHVT